MDSNLLSLTEKWLKWLRVERRYSENTLDAYQRDFKTFIAFLDEYLGEVITIEILLKIDLMTFRAWLANCRKHGMKAVSNARSLSVVRNFFRYINRYHNLDNQAVFYVAQPIRRRNLPKALSEKDIKETIDSIKLDYVQDNWIAARDLAIIYLLYGCGLRISEALNLEKKDAYHDELRIIGKNNKERVIPLLPIVKEQILKYTKVCPHLIRAKNNHYLFCSKFGKKLQRTNFAKYLQKLRLEMQLSDNLTPHAFRHSFATHLLNNDVDIRFIQEILGHSELDTTKVYAHLDNTKMINLYQKFHPQTISQDIEE